MIALISAAYAGEAIFGAVGREQLSFDPNRDMDDEEVGQNSIYARAFASGDLGPSSRWFFETRFQNHIAMWDENVSPTNFDPTFEGWWDLDLGETGYAGRLTKSVDLRAGALIERWGRLELLSSSDILTPRDIRAGVLTPIEFMRRPQPMAVLAVHGGKVRAETVFIPFASSDLVFLQHSNWSPVRKEWAGDLVGDMKTWVVPDSEAQATLNSILGGLEPVVDELDPSLRRGLDAALLQNSIPQALWGNASLAERVEFDWPTVQLAVVGGNVRSTQPSVSINPLLEDILRTQSLPETQSDLSALQEQVLGNFTTTEWPRTWIAGADGSVLAGPVTISAEAMWKSDQVVRQHFLRATTVPSLGTSVGFLYAPSAKVTLLGEAKYTHLFGAPEDLLLARADQVQIAGLLKLALARERLILQTGGLVDLTFGELAGAGPAVTWRATDHLQFDLGGSFLWGKTDAPTGLLGAADPAQDALTYTGGPISFFQTNDSVMLAVQAIY